MKRAPAHLSRESKKFWKGVLARYDLEDHHLKLLQAACESWDRILEARKKVKEADAYFIDRWGQPKEHPGMKVERDNKILFARLLRELGLDIAPPDSRPPSLY